VAKLNDTLVAQHARRKHDDRGAFQLHSWRIAPQIHTGPWYENDVSGPHRAQFDQQRRVVRILHDEPRSWPTQPHPHCVRNDGS
jgi:hypothetical protein